MKKILLVFSTAAAILIMCAGSWASTYTYTDVVNTFYTNSSYTTIADSYLTQGETVYYKFDITDNGFTAGNTLTSASISFSINDGENGWDYFWFCDLTEDISLVADGSSVTRNFEIDNGSVLTIRGSALLSLSTDGILVMVLTVTDGDFTLLSSTLTAQYKDSTGCNPYHETSGGGCNPGDETSGGGCNPGDETTETPEPLSILLLGFGLAGVAGVCRKRKKH